MSACQNPRAGVLIASDDNVPIPLWETGSPFLPPPTDAKPHYIKFVYIRSGTEAWRVLPEQDYVPLE